MFVKIYTIILTSIQFGCILRNKYIHSKVQHSHASRHSACRKELLKIWVHLCKRLYVQLHIHPYKKMPGIMKKMKPDADGCTIAPNYSCDNAHAPDCCWGQFACEGNICTYDVTAGSEHICNNDDMCKQDALGCTIAPNGDCADGNKPDCCWGPFSCQGSLGDKYCHPDDSINNW